jgi:hypothetical protein
VLSCRLTIIRTVVHYDPALFPKAPFLRIMIDKRFRSSQWARRPPLEILPMLPFRRWVPIAAVVAGWLTAAGAYAAVPEIRDEAGIFKPETVRKANEIIRDIHDRFHKDLLIEAFKTAPGNRAEELRKMDPKEREQFFTNWLKERARESRVDGVYVLICMNPGHIEVGVGKETVKKAFTHQNKQELERILVNPFKKKETLARAPARQRLRLVRLPQTLPRPPWRTRHQGEEGGT